MRDSKEEREREQKMCAAWMQTTPHAYWQTAHVQPTGSTFQPVESGSRMLRGRGAKCGGNVNQGLYHCLSIRPAARNSASQVNGGGPAGKLPGKATDWQRHNSELGMQAPG